MLDYDEITQLVLKMRDEEIAKDRRRKMLLRRSATAALSACAAGAILFAVHNSKNPLDTHNGSGIVIPESTAAAETQAPVSTSIPTDTTTKPAKTTSAGKKTGSSTETAAAATGRASAETAQTSVRADTVTNATGAVSSAAVQAPETAVPVVTTIVYESERSFDMKKFLSFAASAALLSNVVNLPASAGETAIARADITREDLAIFEQLDNGTLDPDVNMDGVFDIKDTYYLFAYDYAYDLPQEVADNIAANADFDGSGSIGSGDSRVLLKYFIEKDMVRKEHFDPSFYEDFDIIKTAQGEPIYGCLHPEIEAIFNSEDFDKGAYDWEELEEMYALLDETGIIGYEETKEKFSDIYLRYLRTFMNDLDSYQMFNRYINDGIIDLDINSDGNITLDDINIYWYFIDQRPVKESTDRNHAWIESLLPVDLDPEGLLELRTPDFVTSITDEEWAKCEAVYDFFTNDLGLLDSEFNALEYILRRDGKPDDKYFDNDYYESNLPGSGSIRFGSTVDGRYRMLYPANEKTAFVDYLLYSDILNDYCNRVYNGEIVPGDADGNGIIDEDDALASYVYFSDCSHGITKEESYLPEAAWDFFENELDLDGNGITGEYADLDIYDIGVYAYLYYIENLTGTRTISNKVYEGNLTPVEEYINRLKAAKEGSDTITTDFITNEDVNVLASGASVRSGDANCDGKLNISDAVAVLQYITNPEKYDISALGRINADIDGSRGITGSDAIAIQKLDAGA